MARDKKIDGGRFLQRAYDLGTPASHVGFYRDFADTYDSTFAAGLGYIYPAGIIATLGAGARPDGAVLDIGCGTGLVAAAIRAAEPAAVIDGVDISPEMLDKARDKGDYRALMVADLTADFSHVPTDYAAIVSAGVFTYGHLGPDIIPGLLTLCRSGAVAALGVNSRFFAENPFQKILDDLHAEGRITPAHLNEVPIYDGRDADHRDHMAKILSFTVI